VVDDLKAAGVSVEGIKRIAPSMEDVFIYHITGGDKEE